MKKLIALTAVLVAFVSSGLAGDYTYTTKNGTITITDYTGTNTVVTITNTINGLPVTSIGTNAFYQHTNLTSITIPSSVTNIGGKAFSDCTKLTSIIIPNSVASIGDGAFFWCTSLTNVAIPSSVTSIGGTAFTYCSSLTSITIPNTVTNIGYQALANCTSLTEITVNASNSFYSSVDGVLFNKNQTTIIQCPSGRLGNYTIPSSVTNIGGRAFISCRKMVNITIPVSVVSIGSGAFTGCNSLTNIVVPNSVIDIKNEAFSECLRLTGVYFQGTSPSIGSNLFLSTTNATVYYLPNATGWTNPWAGRPTVLWNPDSLLVITNVVVTQRAGTKLVDITYDVSSTYTNQVWVSLTTICTSAVVNASNLTGDIGAVSVGTGKVIVWDAGADWSGNLAGVSFILTPTEIPPPQSMVLIPKGINNGTDPDFGAYSLTVANPFYMDASEVTKALWDAVYSWALTNGYSFDNAGSGKAAAHPVQTVSWYDCVKWCNARSEKEGQTPCYTVTNGVYCDGAYGTNGSSVVSFNSTANGYRLPTVVEWEYAARGGLIGKRFPWGDAITHSNANYFSSTNYSYDVSSTRGNHPIYASGSLPYTSPDGSFMPTGYGLYDMAGNVSEWCWDLSGVTRRARGGSYNSLSANVRCIYNNADSPNDANNTFGFRTICRPDELAVLASSPSTATAAMDTRDYVLSVSSAHGTPVPSVGTHNYARLASVTCSADNITFDGWMFMGWTGDVSTDYTATNIAVGMDALSKSITAQYSDDADGDGLPNSEEFAIGSNPRMTDTDGDGMNDAQELIAGTSPTNSASVLSISCTLLSNGQKRLSWFGVQGRAYTFQYCNSLNPDSWQSYPFELAGSGTTISFLDSGAISSRFYRVKVRVAD